MPSAAIKAGSEKFLDRMLPFVPQRGPGVVSARAKRCLPSFIFLLNGGRCQGLRAFALGTARSRRSFGEFWSLFKGGWTARGSEKWGEVHLGSRCRAV